MICTISKGKKKRKREGGEVSALPVLGRCSGCDPARPHHGQNFRRGCVLADSGLVPSFPVSRLPATVGSCQPIFSPYTPFLSPPSVLQTSSLVFHSTVFQTALHTNLLGPRKPHPARCPPRVLTATSSPKAFPAGPSKHTLNSSTSAQPLSRAGFSTERSPREVHGAPEPGLNQAALTTDVSPSPQVASLSARAKSTSPNSLSPGSDGLS